MKPTIYLGLGGTGVQTLLYLKQQFVDSYGEERIPKEVAFLGVDTSRFPWIECVDVIGCQIPLSEYYKAQKRKGFLNWFHEENLHGIPTGISFPNASLRTIGRLSADASMCHIVYEFEKRINAICGADANQVDVHIIASLAGGSGSGSLIPIVAAIRNKFGARISVYGYGAMPSVFVENNPPSSQLVLPNGIASIIELDHLFSTGSQSPIDLEVAGEILKIDNTLFDNFFLIDNKDASGNVVTHVDDLCDVLAKTLYSFYLSYDSWSQPIFDSLRVLHSNGVYDVADKKAWVQSLASCSVVYRGDILAEQYQIRAASKMIEIMLHSDTHIREDVLKWIDDNSFRETYDQIIDAICSPEFISNLALPKLNPSKSDAENLDSCIEYLHSSKSLITNETTIQLLSNYQNSLHNVIDNSFIFNGEIGNAIVFLKELQHYCEMFKNKLDGESDCLKRRIKMNDQSNWLTKSYAKYLEQKVGRYIFKRVKKNQDLLDELVGVPVKERIKLIYELERRQLAYSLISEFTKTIEFYRKDLEQYEVRLTNVYNCIRKKAIFNTPRKSFCEIDLSLDELQNMEIDKNDLIVNVFILVGLSGYQSIFDMPEEAIEYNLLIRTANSPRVLKYRSTFVSDVVNQLSNEDFAKLQAEIQSKLTGWLKVSNRGLLNNSYESASNMKKCVGYIGPTDLYMNFADKMGNQMLQCKTQSVSDRLIFTQINSYTIPYCIESLNEAVQIQQIKSKYTHYNPFIDKQWLERMENECFTLIPNKIFCESI